jgi:bisphosphoglycerate-dependent phosphoglycerate mutase
MQNMCHEKTNKKMKIIEHLNHIRTDQRIAMLIRHSDRDKIPEGEFGNEVLLNEKGILNALKMGNELSNFNIRKIYTSPVKRCIQTADSIKKGYGKEIQIIESNLLGNPGAYISEGKDAGVFFMKYGVFKIHEMLLNGIEIAGMNGLEAGSQKLFDFMNLNSNDKELTLYITHDSLVAFFDSYFNHTKYNKDKWPAYLDGVILTF